MFATVDYTLPPVANVADISQRRSTGALDGDVSDDERAFVTPDPLLVRQDVLQRDHPLRATFNGLRWIEMYCVRYRPRPRDKAYR